MVTRACNVVVNRSEARVCGSVKKIREAFGSNGLSSQ